MRTLAADKIRLGGMDDQRKAVMVLLTRLAEAGLEWYRTADAGPGDLMTARAGGQFKPFNPIPFQHLGNKAVADFPANQLLVVEPTSGEKDPFVGIWVRWDFDVDPIVFRLFIGHWCEIDKNKTFVAFRFDAPEKGSTHNFYHCQPCRNIGDKIKLSEFRAAFGKVSHCAGRCLQCRRVDGS